MWGEGAEGVGGREPYPTSDIPNKYNDLFIYFVVVFFTFWYFGIKELIRDSQRLQFCNFVRPSENAQDNVSK